jgi:aryl-alcohol dehydrogenase-like predicted oxidoreductase
MGVMTWSPLAGGMLSGRYGPDRPMEMGAGRPALQPHWFDQKLPENRTKLALTEQLAALAEEIGTTLPALATAFPLAHRAVTSVIIGPRTPDQLRSTLAGAALALDDATLDRIDEIVSPGTDHHTLAWRPPHLDDPSDRRRPSSTRAATGRR